LRGQGKGGLRDYQKYLGLGLQLPATILAGLLLGYVADGHFGTFPWLLIAGAAVGMAVGFTSFFITVLKAEQEEKDRGDEER